MIFITTYRIKQLSKDETKELMGVFADKGVPSTARAHYVAADGSHGVVIAEADDLRGGLPEHPELRGVDRVRHQAVPDDRAGRAPHHGLHRLM